MFKPALSMSLAMSSLIEGDPAAVWLCPACPEGTFRFSCFKSSDNWQETAFQHLTTPPGEGHGMDHSVARDMIGMTMMMAKPSIPVMIPTQPEEPEEIHPTVHPPPFRPPSPIEPPERPRETDTTWVCHLCPENDAYTVNKNRDDWRRNAARHLTTSCLNHHMLTGDARQMVGLPRERRLTKKRANPNPVPPPNPPNQSDSVSVWACPKCPEGSRYIVKHTRSDWRRTAAIHLGSAIPGHGMVEGDAREFVGMKREKANVRSHINKSKMTSARKQKKKTDMMTHHDTEHHTPLEAEIRPPMNGGIVHPIRYDGISMLVPPMVTETDELWYCPYCPEDARHVIPKQRSQWRSHAAGHLASDRAGHGMDVGDARVEMGMQREKKKRLKNSDSSENLMDREPLGYEIKRQKLEVDPRHMIMGVPQMPMAMMPGMHQLEPMDSQKDMWDCPYCPPELRYSIPKSRTQWRSHAAAHMASSRPGHGLDEGDARVTVGMSREKTRAPPKRKGSDGIMEEAQRSEDERIRMMGIHQ